jgi:hypothetical protein
VFVALVDTREPPEEGGGSTREPWLAALLDWVLPWPALIAWLCVASRVLDGFLAFAAIYAALLLTVWRALRAMPSHGLDEYRQ